jgi:retron-type reverse transcriptase
MSYARRGLGIPNVIDRLIQQAVHQVLSPHFEPGFHESSHGFRPGRSCHTAIVEAREYVEEGYDWLVDIDLAKFFDHVHHQRLLARLEKGGVKDHRLLRIIRKKRWRTLQSNVNAPNQLRLDLK